MNDIYTTELVSLASALTQLAFKGTATAISNKIRLIKDEKNAEKIKVVYEEIINELLSERDEAIRIAQSYKQEIEKIVISDEDIQHLHNTASRIIEIVKVMQLSTAARKDEAEVKRVQDQVAGYEQIKQLISVDSLKTMQLLGFNYKAAIGEPLTEICADAIISFGKRRNQSKKKDNSK